MTPNIGGISSKLGNRYEAKWLVLRFFDVISGQANWVRFEGVTEDFLGFEFALHRKDRAEWHQTKLSAPNGNWTVGALAREEVLSAFGSRLEANSEDVCVFVSQDPAKDLRDLISKAAMASDLREFDQSLSDKLRNAVAILENVWKSDRQTTIQWLRRCESRSPDTRTIEDDTTSLSDLYFDAAPNAFAVLRDYLEEHFNQTITTDKVRADLHTSGRLNLKHWSLDPTLIGKLATETRQYLDTYTPFGAGGRNIRRKEVAALADLLTKPEGPTVVLLTGTAGTGKSGVTRGLIERLEGAGILHLAFRVDHHLECRTTQDFGKALTGRSESPATTLKGLRPEDRTVLIVDQVDAVSEVSGRSGTVREAVLRLVNDARNFATVRLVLVCRSFDLESDSRLKTLKDAQHIQEIKVPLLDWKNEVEPFLREAGIATAAFSQGQRELLRLPLNLAVFTEVADDARPFATRTDLFDRLLEKKDRAIRSRHGLVWAATQPLSDLAHWMSERQRLDAPEGVLKDYPGALDLLTSEHLIVRSRKKVNFFHESFFDYLYATDFATRAQSLCELLTSSEQHLFRRTQTRQILEALRQSERPRYLSELKAVLTQQDIRYHIKNAVGLWLGALPDPTSAEANVVRGLDAQDKAFSPLVRHALLGSAGWFDVLLKEGWIVGELSGSHDERRQHVLRWLSAIAADRPVQVAKLLERWWADEPGRGKLLLDWFGYVRRGTADKELITLCEKVIVSRPEGIETGALQRRELLLATWVATQSRDGAGILRALFDAWFDGHPGQHPFDTGQVRDIDLYSLGETAKKSPHAFLEGASPALVRTISIINDRKEQGISDYSFSIRSASGQRFGADAFLDSYRSSLRNLAETDPAEALRALTRFDPSLSPIFLHLHLEAISASKGALADHFLTLLPQPALCEAGWNGAGWKSFADAAATVFPTLSPQNRARTEDAILGFQPELADAMGIAHHITKEGESEWRTRSEVVWWLNRSGSARWGILETIGADRLSPRGSEALEECRRKFRGETLEEPIRNEAGWVGSPIARDRAAHMTDEQWLRAMRRYNTEEGRRRRRFMEGGASQLASELQHLTKSNPARFAALVRAIPDDANTAYIEHVLWGLAECDDVAPQVLKPAIHDAHARPCRSYGRAIIRIFERHPHIARDRELYDILAWYVENGDANENDAIDKSNVERETFTIDDLLEKGGRLHVRGVNGARGSAAEALGQVLWKVPEAIAPAWDLAERRAVQEPLISVRCCLVRTLIPLFNSDRVRCASLLEKLVQDPLEQVKEAAVGGAELLSPLITHEGTRFLPYILTQVPEVGRRLVQRLVQSPSDVLRLIGCWHVFRQSFSDPSYRAEADMFVEQGPAQRRLAADLTAGAIVHEEFRNRAEGYLIRFFGDEDADVRRQAADVFRNIEPKEFYRFKELAHRYIHSPAFDTDAVAFLHALENATCDVSELIVDAATQLVSSIDADSGSAGGKKGTELHQLQDLLQREYSASEGNEQVRKRLLDVIDTMLARELYGTDAIVKAHDRS